MKLTAAQQKMLDEAEKSPSGIILHGSGARATAKSLERRLLGKFLLRPRYGLVPNAHFYTSAQWVAALERERLQGEKKA